MNGMPFSYTSRLLGSATTYEGLSSYYPLEAGTPEGSLIFMQLDYEDFPTNESVESLNQQLLDAGVLPWPGNTRIIYQDANYPILYLQWVKAIWWLTIIIGMLVIGVLPVLLGGLIWWIIPQEVKDLIMMAGFMLMMMGMFQIMKPMLAEGKK